MANFPIYGHRSATLAFVQMAQAKELWRDVQGMGAPHAWWYDGAIIGAHCMVMDSSAPRLVAEAAMDNYTATLNL